MFETRKELFSKIDAQAADITRLESELAASEAKVSAATNADETIAGLNEDLEAAQTALKETTAAKDKEIGELKASLAAAETKSSPEAIQALVTAQIAASGHPPLPVEGKTEKPDEKEEIKSLTGLAKVTASFKAANTAKPSNSN